MKNLKMIRRLILMLALAMSMTFAAGCSEETTSEPADAQEEAVDETVADAEEAEAVDDAGSDEAETADADSDDAEAADADSEAADETESLVSTDTDALYLDPNGTYDSADDVALYLYLYDELPSNYMTKKEAQALGWSGGSLEQYAEGMCIGGSYFGNNEGILPEEDSYHECDIDTLGASKRGAKRLVYSEDGDIYYTEDHYETFTLLYTADGPVTEEIVYGG